MSNRKFVAATVILGACLVSISSLQIRAADISKSLVGAWRVASLSTMTLGTNEISRPFGEDPNGYLQYSQFGDAGRQKGRRKTAPLDRTRASDNRRHSGPGMPAVHI
jgi:hypothetical protein